MRGGAPHFKKIKAAFILLKQVLSFKLRTYFEYHRHYVDFEKVAFTCMYFFRVLARFWSLKKYLLYVRMYLNAYLSYLLIDSYQILHISLFR